MQDDELYKRFTDALKRRPKPGPSEDFVAKVMAEIPAEPKSQPWAWVPDMRWLAPAFGAAAVAMALIFSTPATPASSEALLLALGGDDPAIEWATESADHGQADVLSAVVDE